MTVSGLRRLAMSVLGMVARHGPFDDCPWLADDVRMYPLPKVLEVHHVGRRSLPEGLHLLSDRQHRNSGLLTTTDILTEAAPEE